MSKKLPLKIMQVSPAMESMQQKLEFLLAWSSLMFLSVPSKQNEIPLDLYALE